MLNRGEVVVEERELVATRGRGRFVARATVDLTGRPGYRAPELDPVRNFGADIAP